MPNEATTKRKSRTKVVALTAALMLFGGVAYAFWTAGGSGTGTAETGTTTGLTVNQDALTADLAPGVAAQTLSGDFDNTNDGPVYVTSVTTSIDSVTKAQGAPTGTCDASDYTLTDATMTVDAEVATGDGVGSWSGATLAFNNKTDTNQDACKGATVTLAYSVS